jgi:hypothetical protein
MEGLREAILNLRGSDLVWISNPPVNAAFGRQTVWMAKGRCFICLETPCGQTGLLHGRKPLIAESTVGLSLLLTRAY